MFFMNENGSVIFLQPTDKEEIADTIRLLVQIVYLVEYYFFQKMKFPSNWQVYLTSTS